MNSDSLKFDTITGLIPAIVQDAVSGQVLMLGYMNEETLKLTISNRKVTFFSRSRNEIWVKGETSGNYLHLVSIQADCDNDSLLILANPDGPTCHTGNTSCFHQLDEVHQSQELSFLSELESLLIERKQTLPENSYTAKMFTKGLDKIAQKVGEEAVETVIAAKNTPADEFIYEAGDLVFHLIMLCVEKQIPFKKIIDELKRRHK